LLECPPGKTVLGAGEIISWSEMLRVWCGYNEVSFGGFDQLSIDVFERFVSVAGLGRELGEMFAFMDEFGYAGGDLDVVLPSEASRHSSCQKWANRNSLEFIVRSPVGKIGWRGRIGPGFSAVEEDLVRKIGRTDISLT
jgi:hypothetical protein